MFRITRIARLETLSHQLMQRCSVSGTAKGKAKLKTGQTLKRSKITRKKGAAESPSAPKGGGGRRNEELDKMITECLNAPTPIRYLKPKDREREAERQKLGLVSEASKREIEMLKKKNNNKKKKGNVNDDGGEESSSSTTIIGTPGFDLISLGLVDAEDVPKYELTVEDGRRLAKEYSRVLMRQHRARRAAESTILRLKKEAIDALPEHLKAAALVPDFTPFPANRFMATLTPPIEGYIEKIKEATKRSNLKEKLR